jgi:hypothetical protein
LHWRVISAYTACVVFLSFKKYWYRPSKIHFELALALALAEKMHHRKNTFHKSPTRKNTFHKVCPKFIMSKSRTKLLIENAQQCPQNNPKSTSPFHWRRKALYTPNGVAEFMQRFQRFRWGSASEPKYLITHVF